jgi:hypothetical protein
MTLEQRIEDAAGILPEGWSITIEVENGAASIVVHRPDGTVAHIDDDERDISELFSCAVAFVRDEKESELNNG